MEHGRAQGQIECLCQSVHDERGIIIMITFYINARFGQICKKNDLTKLINSCKFTQSIIH